MKNYTMDFTNNVLTISENFNKKAMVPNSDEYKTLLVLKKDFPGLQIVIKPAPKRKNASARLTYDMMVKYLSCQSDAERLLLMFNQIREHSTSQRTPYLYVKNWFLEQFPDYFEYPSFDENGKLINPRAASAVAEGAKRSEQIKFPGAAA